MSKDLSLSGLKEGADNPFHPIALRRDIDSIRHDWNRLKWLVGLCVASAVSVITKTVVEDYHRSRLPPAPAIAYPDERTFPDRVDKPQKP